MPAGPRVLRIYCTATGERPFQKWIDALTDLDAQTRILVRLERLRLGNMGDWKSVGEGVCELRVDAGPGYRVYFGQDGTPLVILLCGGTKATQVKDIANAKAYWKDYRRPTDDTKRIIR